MYKVVFIDIDGTLRNEERAISERTIESIRKAREAGILVVICSGRPRNHTEAISKQCHASSYIIASNGGQIYDYEKQEVLYINPMSKQACIKLFQIAEEREMTFVMNIETGRVTNKIRKNIADTLLKEPIETFLEKNNVAQCILIDSDFEKVKALKEIIENIEGVAIKNCSKSLTNPNIKPFETTYYDVADIHTSKGEGIKQFCKKMKIDLKDAIAIGDDFNDVSMFEAAGYAVVMGNANEKIKEKYADEITKTNDEDGVAAFLEKLVQNPSLKKEEEIC